MAVDPVTVVLVHGHGGLESEGWKTRFVLAAREMTGWDLLDTPGLHLTAPPYRDVLRDAPHAQAVLRTQTVSPEPSVVRDYWQRRAAAKESLEGWLADQDASSSLIPASKSLQRFGAWLGPDDADVYYDYKWARRRAIQRVLDAMPPSGRVILIGHSLGSAVALSSLTRLPSNVQVPLFLTLGSPLGLAMFSDHLALEASEAFFPYARVGVWANAYAVDDQVTQGRGIHTMYPPALDLPLPKGIGHGLTGYMGNPVVVRLLVDAMFGRDQRYAPGFVPSVARSFTDGIANTWPP